MEKLYCPYCGKRLVDGQCEENCEIEAARYEEERSRQFYEDYYSNPEVQYGWHQQDLIDMYRRER